MQHKTKNPATPASVNGTKSKAFSQALRSTEDKLDGRKKQAVHTFDETRKQSNSLKLMSALLEQRQTPSYQPAFNALPSNERLDELLIYNRSGLLINKVSRGCVKAGQIAGHKQSEEHNSYVIVTIDGTAYRAHRIIWKMVHGRDPIGPLDHVDGNRSRNCIENLREVTPVQNAQNKNVCKSNTGQIGVSQCSRDGLYFADIGANNRIVHLGKFTRLSCAVKARKHAEGILFDLPTPLIGRAA